MKKYIAATFLVLSAMDAVYRSNCCHYDLK